MLDRISSLSLWVSSGTLALNLLLLRAPRGEVAELHPRVSLLVPARDEALNIAACVGSLLAQDYPNFELLVLDDRSEDGTAEILEGLRGDSVSGARRFRVLHGDPPPEGWSGKNWACQQLAGAADPKAEFLLFTDADTIHSPGTTMRCVAEALRDDLALLSLLPRQEVVSAGERLVVPLLNLQILSYIPLLAIEMTPFPLFAAANGQYLLFRREAYRRLGGHAAIAGEIAEDLLLARRAKRHGRVRLADGTGLVECRMYRTLPEILKGLRRSFSSGFRIDPVISWSILIMNVVGYLLPFLRAPFSARARRMCLAVLALRLMLALRAGSPLSTVAGHPLGILLLVYSQIRAALDQRSGTSVDWKGRAYPLHDA